MYNKEGFDSFENIAQQYGLSNNHFYRYLQVRNYLKEKVQIRTLEDLHPLLRYMIKTNQSHELKSAVRQTNQILQGIKPDNLGNIKVK